MGCLKKRVSKISFEVGDREALDQVVFFSLVSLVPITVKYPIAVPFAHLLSSGAGVYKEVHHMEFLLIAKL